MKTPSGEPLRFLHVSLAQDTDDCIYWPYNKRKGYAAIRWGKKTANVNRVVCEYRNGPPPTAKHEAAHNCGNGHLSCINPKHLEWKTHKENCADKMVHGTAQIGEKNPYSVLCESQVREIMRLKGTASARIIAEKYEVSRETVSHIHNGRKWAHLFTQQST